MLKIVYYTVVVPTPAITYYTQAGSSSNISECFANNYVILVKKIQMNKIPT